MVKTDALGNIEWNQTYGGTWSSEVSSLVETTDGGYAMAGYAQFTGSTDFWLVKTDALGNMQWNRTYGDLGENVEMASALVATSDGRYAVAGRKMFAGPSWDNFWLVKTDSFGNMQWNQTYGGNAIESANSLVATSDGGYALAGRTTSFGAGSDDFWVVKTDEFGVLPEYSSWLIPALVLTATAFIIINKKRLLNKRS